MAGADQWRAQLIAIEPAAWPDFLDEHSNLPGPRGNLELAAAFADLAADDADLIDALVASPDEYRRFCGTLALGVRAGEPEVQARLRTLATDGLWRVREGVATGLQRLGDRDFPTLRRLVLQWADDADPLVQRAAAAAICEPRLLRTPEAAATAIEVCRRTTTALAARPAQTRRQPEVRVLRKGLGYCWSVAVAADPRPGLAAFHTLDDSDADVAWIITQNRGKARMVRALEQAAQ